MCSCVFGQGNALCHHAADLFHQLGLEATDSLITTIAFSSAEWDRLVGKLRQFKTTFRSIFPTLDKEEKFYLDRRGNRQGGKTLVLLMLAQMN